jgi:hypothetical protein
MTNLYTADRSDKKIIVIKVSAAITIKIRIKTQTTITITPGSARSSINPA